MERNLKGAKRMHVAVVCSAVGAFGLVTVALGVAGEAYTAHAFVRRVGDSSNDVDSYKCVYQTTPALGCGIIAALFALTAQVVGTAAACCWCFRKCELAIGTNRVVAIVLSFISWIMVLIAVALFVAGGALNTDREALATVDNNCSVAPGSELFAGATVLSLIATGLQIVSCILLQKAAAGSAAAQQGPSPVATGQPVKPEPQRVPEHAAHNGSKLQPPPPVPAPPEGSAEPTNQV
ncbi:hypothetical protein ACP70R_020724 [Stipagrostis hirtigluma subsp. patula]